MSITTFTRWKGGNEKDMVQAAKEARKLFMKHGATAVQVHRFHNGPFMGEWLVSISYPDWSSYGKAQDGLASDASYQKLVGKVGGMAQVAGRATLVGYDIE
jgi:hypothetical protein